MTTATSIGQKLWNYCNILRVAGQRQAHDFDGGEQSVAGTLAGTRTSFQFRQLTDGYSAGRPGSH